jgi:predicted transcriptional regulator
MRIEVANLPGSPTKDKGDLLEQLAGEFLRTQGFTVTEEIRVTATELDLLCQHKVNKRQVYVECKAYRDTLSATVLRQLLGTLKFHEYQEAWLISAGPLGKDAKGFQHTWESKPVEESQRLSIYTPDRVIDALTSAKVICLPPIQSAAQQVGSEELLGEWLLLVTEYGNYWVVSCLSSGVPVGVLVFNSKSGVLVDDQELLRRLGKTDSSQSTLDFEYVSRLNESPENEKESVVEVEHGESWRDYRPAMPEHFVGRVEAQNTIFRLLETVRAGECLTRVFAITGDSGMGKSSLIAKIRSRSKNIRNRRKFFTYAVDIRAANGPTYILSALYSCLYKAAEAGFGSNDAASIKISDSTQPLESDSIKRFLRALEEKNEVVCLIFDQFEELYSKIELFPVFIATQQLFLSTIAAQSNLVLGFAWKSDATVQQNHPAYHMWHNLADHRLEVSLRPFNHSEAFHAITIFEKELGQHVAKGLRRQLIENSQGYPWLLKKLCIHLYENIKDGVIQIELSDNAQTLFDKDLQKLTPAERTCLKLIAQHAPADWYEILENSGQDVTNSLRDKRLIVRSGDRLNIYWDIFREYILTGKVPSIPLNFVPSSPSMKSVLRLAWQLHHEEAKSIGELAELTGLTEGSAENVVRDLVMFGLATSNQGQVLLHSSTAGPETEQVLQRLRSTLRQHALRLELAKMEEGTLVNTKTIIELLKELNPAAQHNTSTWKIYADRMGSWLSATGYLIPVEGGWRVKDQGKVPDTIPYRKRSIAPIFIGDSSPAKAAEALDFFRAQSPRTREQILGKEYRNAVAILQRFGLVKHEKGEYYLNSEAINQESNSWEIIWNAAQKEPTLLATRKYLTATPAISGPAIGKMLNQEFQREWTAASESRIGNSIRQWAVWTMYGRRDGEVIKPPGRVKENTSQASLGTLFDQ